MIQAILDRSKAVLTLLVASLIAGVAAYINIPKEANPDIDVPVFYVSVAQQGISAEDSERLLVRPLETKLRNLDGLKKISGVASEGHGAVIVEFNIDFDKDAALADVRAKVDQASAELPADADEPVVTETNFSLVPTVLVTVAGDAPERAIFQSARRLKDALQAIPTVLEAKLAGHREELLEVIIDTVRLESYDISQEELLRTVSSNNQLVPAGALDTGQGRFNIKVPGLFEDARDVMALPVKVSRDGVVTLGDVAEVRRSFKDAVQFTRVDGKPAIVIEVVKRLGTNIIENNAAVRQVVADFTREWPETIRVGFLLDQSNFITEVIGGLESNVIAAIVLVMLITLAALGWRSSLLVGLAIPSSFLLGFLLLEMWGISVNIMVLFSLVVTAGIVVDGATVVVEYADRRIAEGVGRREAYNQAAEKMLWPVIAGTMTTLVAFLPMLLWPGVAGEFMSYLPRMVIFVLAASLVTALIFVPVLGRYVGRKSVSREESAFADAMAPGQRFDPRRVPGLTGVYARLLAVCARHPGVTALMVIAAVAGGFVAYARHPTGVEFFVNEEPDQAVVLVSARGNLSALEERDLVGLVEREVLAVPGIARVVTTSGNRPGALKIGGTQDPPADQIGSLMLELAPFAERRRAAEIFDEIRERTGPIAGIKVEARKIEGGPPSGKAVRIEIGGHDWQTVKTVAGAVRRQVDAMEGLRDREDTRPLPGIEWQLSVDRAEAGRFGADVSTVGTMIQLVTTGALVGKYRPDDSEDEIDIRVRLPESERSLDRLDDLNVRTANGIVPIRNFVVREAQPRVTSITRTDGLYTMQVKADVVDGVLGDDKVRELDAWLKQQKWPEGIAFKFRGADEGQKESGAFLVKAMIGALFLMLLILVTQFNSIYQTLLTLTTIVMSIGGVLYGMVLTGQPFSIIMSGIGVLALAGVVVNNAIIFIDTFNEKRADGVPTEIAAVATGAERVRPVLLTTATTIIGLVPNAVEWNIDFFARQIVIGSITSMWWVQMSTAIIAGLTFATILTLIFVPAMLAAPAVWGAKIAGLRRSIARPSGGKATGPSRPRPMARPEPFREAAE